MKAVIFCAGKGTRLKSLSKNMPKQLIELQGKTVLEHIFDLLKRHNIKEVVLVVEGLPPVTQEEMSVILEEFKQLIEEYCGGKIRTAVLGEACFEVEI